MSSSIKPCPRCVSVSVSVGVSLYVCMSVCLSELPFVCYLSAAVLCMLTTSELPATHYLRSLGCVFLTALCSM